MLTGYARLTPVRAAQIRRYPGPTGGVVRLAVRRFSNLRASYSIILFPLRERSTVSSNRYSSKASLRGIGLSEASLKALLGQIMHESVKASLPESLSQQRITTRQCSCSTCSSWHHVKAPAGHATVYYNAADRRMTYQGPLVDGEVLVLLAQRVRKHCKLWHILILS